ncbi:MULTISPECIES: (2Fe-2S)-binding protein [unclassified Phyllobacterium]|uniref:(2Fe-2S)-binding protein n=1 Tax=unclassified Phyllobacterium TaxID=2638441 RepID=UPI001AC116F2|nr:(2Fe-2S)-binding protein [Phyllobacterium sp.]MBQ9353696.1 (2Fe-2S)-binding protein [Phyllobacterium sp.]
MAAHHSRSQFQRHFRRDEAPIPFTIDGIAYSGRRGDTVLVAIMSVTDRLRQSEFTNEPRAGFCLIGACQDCFVTLACGTRVRACTTPLEAQMAFITRESGNE